MLSALTLTFGLLLPPLPADQARPGDPSLGAQATASSRPKECAPSGRRAKKITVWQRVRFPKLAPYCDHVARAHALLKSDAAGALAAADAAEKTWAGRPGASVARGRALLALGKAKESLAAFEAASKIDRDAIADPSAIRDFARALVLEGRVKEGAEAYRVLVPRTELLNAEARARALLEAAFASMTTEAAANAPAGPEGKFTEALSFLNELREDEGSPMRAEAMLAAALVHGRRGDAAKATTLAAEATRMGVDATASPWVAAAADQEALRALALEARQPEKKRGGAPPPKKKKKQEPKP
jgi:hypothetical protein